MKKMLRFPGQLTAAAVGLLLCLAGGAVGQYDPTIVVPVTFYDFLPDRSNPEFEQPHQGTPKENNQNTARKGTVQDRLDKDNKPMAHVTNNYLNQGIRFWFRDWNNLSSYAMATEADAVTSGRTYLQKFRPVYMYRGDGEAARSSGGGTASPPGVRQFSRGDGSANLYATNNNDWNAEVNADLKWEKNAYAVGDLPANYRQNQASAITDAYKNNVIPANLVFSYVANSAGMYRFERTGDNGFFPMDNVPNNLNYGSNMAVEFTDRTSRSILASNWWGTDGNKNVGDKHKYSFTMEMSWKFKYERAANLVFDFTGDDDVWVFINGRLAMDIGGIHQAVDGRIDLNTQAAALELREGMTYDFHMFYAERHAMDSNIKITTNLITARLDRLDIVVEGGPMVAGTPKLARAEVAVDTGAGVLKEFNKGHFLWSARDEGGFNTGTQLKVSTTPTGPALTSTTTTKSDSVYVTAEKAYTYVWIKGVYYDSLTRSSVVDSIRVFVGPGPAAQLFVESSADTNQANLRNHPTSDSVVTILSSESTVNNFFAIQRDQYGNWVGPAALNSGRTLVWTVTNEAIATIASVANTMRGQGIATRVAINEGRSPFTVTYSGTGLPSGGLTANSVVKVENITYTGIRVGIKTRDGTFIPMASSTETASTRLLELNVGEDTVLYVQLRRSAPDANGNEWVEADARWVSENIPGLAAELALGRSWQVKPTDATENGRITVNVPGSTANSAVLNVVVKWNDPASMRISHRRGRPRMDSVVTAYSAVRDNSPTRLYATPTASVRLIAGRTMPLVASMFATAVPDSASWLSNYSGGNSPGRWAWSFVEGSPTTGTITTSLSNNNDSVTFRSTVATYSGTQAPYYRLRAVFTQTDKQSITQDIYIEVIPDVEQPKVVIERNKNGRTLAPNDLTNTYDTLVFVTGEESKTVYAVIRDVYNNYICPSGGVNPYSPPDGGGSTAWTPGVENAITAVVGEAAEGEGIVTVVNMTRTTLTAKPTAVSSWGDKSVTVPVIFRDYNYVEIKIVACGNAANPSYDQCDDGNGTLVMDSNQDTTLYVFGLRSDCGDDGKPTGNACWERVPGGWNRDGELIGVLDTPPGGADNWTLSPSGSGTGQIVVTDPVSGKSDTLRVIINLGPPTRVELVILTPADEIIAGREITMAVRYYNRAGLMTGWDLYWENNGSYFADTLGKGSNKAPEPKVISAKGEDVLQYFNTYCAGCTNATLAHGSGVDTVKFVIFYAAENHQIRYKEAIAGNALTTTSERFTVKPGEPKEITIVGPDCAPGVPCIVDGELRLTPDNSNVVLRVVAEDEYGNVIGDWPSDWTSEKPIPIDTKDRPLIVYNPERAEENGEGPLCATAIINGQPSELTTCINVVITGVTLRALSATTRDYDGCGYLDAIELKFSKPIRVAENNAGRIAKIRLSYNGTNPWTVDSATVSASDPTLATIWLKDKVPHTGALQTGWKPTLVLSDSVFIIEDGSGSYVLGQTHQAADGAPPVIKAALLYHAQRATEKNRIEVEFSEDVVSSQGTSFRLVDPKAFPPEVLFKVWEVKGQSKAKQARTRALSKSSRLSKSSKLSKKAEDPNAGRVFEDISDRLVGIVETTPEGNTKLSFFLDEGKELGPPRHYINIKANLPSSDVKGRAHIWDTPQNVPDTNNRRVAIAYATPPNEKAVAIPNPASPSDKKKEDPPGTIRAVHDPVAIDGIRDGQWGGTVVQVPIYVPNSGGVKCQIKVYDLAGNLVNSGESKGKADPDGAEKEAFSKIDLYWNGYNSKSMKVAPGTYRMVVYISYTKANNNNENDRKFAKNKKFQALVGMSK